MRATILSLLALAACHHGSDPAPVPAIANAHRDVPVVIADAAVTEPPVELPPPAPPPVADIDSQDILARDPTSEHTVFVKHVLIAWADLAPIYRSRMDPRAAGRDNAAAAQLAREVLAKLQADPTQLDALVTSTSEDPGSLGGEPYEVAADTPFVPEFKNLSRRLHVGEAGIVRTHFGYHVIVRIAPPLPDPLESAAILARPAGTGTAIVQHILIGWHGTKTPTHDPRAERTKAEADALAVKLLARVRRGDKMAALMKEFSEDPGSKDDAHTYDVTPTAGMVAPFKELALRLKVGEAGLVKTTFGWHVIKRLPPPPPDSLASVAILQREPPATSAKVKHILLGWTGAHASDPRGEKRTRAELERLVKATVAKLRKGTAIEPLMAELSEDPGSAKTGEGYDVVTDGPMVQRFKDLSLRLAVGEIGVVDTNFGIHIIKRTE